MREEIFRSWTLRVANAIPGGASAICIQQQVSSFVARLRGVRLTRIVFLCLGVMTAAGTAHADLGVMVADPTTVGASAFTHAGHSLVYLSGVCADTPVRARLCRVGESGSVVTRYPKFHETSPYGWNIVPAQLYLEGTMQPGSRLLHGSQNVKDALGARARDGFMKPVCSGACPFVPHSYWRDMVAAPISRDIFIFTVRTSPEEDEGIVRWLNAHENLDDYNGMTNNCAEFVRAMVNDVFPHSVRRDVINDIGMMTPKAAVHSFTRWAEKHPDSGFYILHFSQKPGSIPRSGVASSGTETAIHVKKYLIPAALIGDHEVAGSFFVAYFLTGRFNLYKEYIHHSNPELTRLRQVRKEAVEEPKLQLVKSEIVTRERETTGGEEEWADYRRRFQEMREEAGTESLEQFGRQLDLGTVFVDANEDAWIVPRGDTRKVGLRSRNVLAEGSDPELALKLMMWRVNFCLKAKPRMRPDIVEFRQDWRLLEQAYSRTHTTKMLAGAAAEAEESPTTTTRGEDLREP
jgi:hypothetical protein